MHRWGGHQHQLRRAGECWCNLSIRVSMHQTPSMHRVFHVFSHVQAPCPRDRGLPPPNVVYISAEELCIFHDSKLKVLLIRCFRFISRCCSRTKAHTMYCSHAMQAKWCELALRAQGQEPAQTQGHHFECMQQSDGIAPHSIFPSPWWFTNCKHAFCNFHKPEVGRICPYCMVMVHSVCHMY